MDRIQRTRQSKLPPNTLCVTRPGKYGNPFKVGERRHVNNEQAVESFREWIVDDEQYQLRNGFIAECKEKGIEHLACWCALDNICHADVWLEVWEALK
jgi:hypothetical protein